MLWSPGEVLGKMTSGANLPRTLVNNFVANVPNWTWKFTLSAWLPVIIGVILMIAVLDRVRDRWSLLIRPAWSFTPYCGILFSLITLFMFGLCSVVLQLPSTQETNKIGMGIGSMHTWIGVLIFLLIVMTYVGITVVGSNSNHSGGGCCSGRHHRKHGHNSSRGKHGFNFPALFFIHLIIFFFILVLMVAGGMLNSSFFYLNIFPFGFNLWILLMLVALWHKNTRGKCD